MAAEASEHAIDTMLQDSGGYGRQDPYDREGEPEGERRRITFVELRRRAGRMNDIDWEVEQWEP